MLKQYTDLPRGFLDASAAELERILGGPSLIHLPGLRDRPLFVSILLHGNETSGLTALQEFLRTRLDRPLPRALSLFVGNVAAARAGVRTLPGQPDYNRIWPGGEDSASPEARMLALVVDQMRQRRVFASIDIHNNSGPNPHYSCISRVDGRHLYLASLFSPTVVHFTRPRGVQVAAFAELCPAVTIECGQPGDRYGIEHARELVEAALHLGKIPDHPASEVSLFRTVARVLLPADVTFGYGDEAVELQLMDDLAQFNFRELPVGTIFARVRGQREVNFVVEDQQGRDVAADYFELVDGELRTRRPVMPAMLTTNPAIVRQDCLCYLMEGLPTPADG
ncbi:MAG: peptidase M14 [Xanthomonadaceae bacterium]|nr:peptidase M14 [Xanthomonadaceae bacterium]